MEELVYLFFSFALLPPPPHLLGKHGRRGIEQTTYVPLMDGPKPESTSENNSCGGTRPVVEPVRPVEADMTKVECNRFRVQGGGVGWGYVGMKE